MLGWIPIFSTDSIIPASIFAGGVVLAIMILPIVTAISREVFTQTPRTHKEAALALGATKWEMIRTAVLPFGRPGVISASMLGLGRALGETIAVLLIINEVARRLVVVDLHRREHHRGPDRARLRRVQLRRRRPAPTSPQGSSCSS